MALSVDLKDIKPILGGLFGGGKEETPAAPPVPMTPPPPQATPAVAGFSEWSGDPMNQEKVAHGLTQPGQSIIPPNAQPSLTPPPPAPQMSSLSGPPNLPPAPSPVVTTTPPPSVGQAKLKTDQDELQRLQDTGSGASQIKNKPGRIAAEIGDVAASVLLPGQARYIPGTTAHNMQLQGQAQGRVANDQTSLQDAANLERTQQQIAMAPEQLDIKQQAQDLKEQQAKDELERHYAALGYKRVTAVDGKTSFIPDEVSPAYQKNQAVIELDKNKAEFAKASADYKKAQAANQPQMMELAYQRAITAKQNAQINAGKLGLSQKNFELKAFGTVNGKAPPGALLDDNDNPIGTAFQRNVLPTGTERNKGDMAASASEQLADIKDIMQRHGTLFGPGYGQTSQFRQWAGSQDPDAQRFMAARTIAADHLAGTFGGRSEAALDALDKAIGQFKDNPAAAIAGVDQLTKANSRFQVAGTPRTVGSKAGQKSGAGGPPPASSGSPKENDTKVNSSGDKVRFTGGKWGPA